MSESYIFMTPLRQVVKNGILVPLGNNQTLYPAVLCQLSCDGRC